MKNNINLTSINEEELKRISKKKTSLIKKAIALGFVVVIGVGSYIVYKKNQPELKFDPKVPLIQQDFMQEPSGVVDVNGSKIDLAKLYEDYGSLYYLIEPMTEEQINDQFNYVKNNLSAISTENKKREAEGLLPLDMSGLNYHVQNADTVNKYGIEYNRLYMYYYGKMVEFVDKRFEDYYYKNEIQGLLQQNLDFVDIKTKEKILRYLKYQSSLTKEIYKNLGWEEHLNSDMDITSYEKIEVDTQNNVVYIKRISLL